MSRNSKILLGDAYQIEISNTALRNKLRIFCYFTFCTEGPFSTKDHQIGLEVLPLDEGRTFIHLRYSLRYSPLGYFLMKSYFFNIWWRQDRFSVIGTDRDGNPCLCGWPKGRNRKWCLLRYYLAILAYMDTLKIPIEQRFEKRISQWYDLTNSDTKGSFQNGKGRISHLQKTGPRKSG